MDIVLSAKQLIETVHASLDAERENNIEAGRALLHPDFHKTSMFASGERLFPVLTSQNVEAALESVYAVKGREFHVFNTAADEAKQTVFFELVEIEPNKNGSSTWPYVFICEFKDGLIWHTRHYGDPSLVHRELLLDEIITKIQS